MQLLKDRILTDGVVKEGNILKVDSFLNHQMDIKNADLRKKSLGWHFLFIFRIYSMKLVKLN